MLNCTFKIVSLINDVLNVKLKVLEKLSNILHMTCMSDVTAASHHIQMKCDQARF